MKISVQAVKTIETSKVKVKEINGFGMRVSDLELVEITFTGGARLATLGKQNPDGSARTLNYKSISIGESFRLMTMFDGMVVSLIPENLPAAMHVVSALSGLEKRVN